MKTTKEFDRGFVAGILCARELLDVGDDRGSFDYDSIDSIIEMIAKKRGEILEDGILHGDRLILKMKELKNPQYEKAIRDYQKYFEGLRKTLYERKK